MKEESPRTLDHSPKSWLTKRCLETRTIFRSSSNILSNIFYEIILKKFGGWLSKDFYFQLWQPFCSGEGNPFVLVREYSKDNFCETIFNCTSGSGVDAIIVDGIMRNISIKLF